jgi:lipoprotein-anchoring transpeptidase ErfK/SrfK
VNIAERPAVPSTFIAVVRHAAIAIAVLAVAGSLSTADAGLFKKKPPPVTYVDDDLSNLPPLKGENQVAKQWQRTPVSYRSQYPAGTIIIDTSDRYLYLLTGQGTAIRYGVAVGRDGYTWEGSMKVTKKAEWPDWRPREEEGEDAAAGGQGRAG